MCVTNFDRSRSNRSGVARGRKSLGYAWAPPRDRGRVDPLETCFSCVCRTMPIAIILRQIVRALLTDIRQKNWIDPSRAAF